MFLPMREILKNAKNAIIECNFACTKIKSMKLSICFDQLSRFSRLYCVHGYMST